MTPQNTPLEISEEAKDVGIKAFGDGEMGVEHSKIVQLAINSAIAKLREEKDNADKAYETTKAWSHLLNDKLVTLLLKCDDCADGAPDATPLAKFCNEMIGLCNAIDIKEVQTLRQERDQLKLRVEELEKERDSWKERAVAYAPLGGTPVELPSEIESLQKQIVGLREVLEKCVNAWLKVKNIQWTAELQEVDEALTLTVKELGE